MMKWARCKKHAAYSIYSFVSWLLRETVPIMFFFFKKREKHFKSNDQLTLSPSVMETIKRGWQWLHNVRMLGQHSVFLSTISSRFQDSVATADSMPTHYSMPAGGKGQQGKAPPEDLAFYLGSKSFPEDFSLPLISYNSLKDTPRCLGSGKGEDLSEQNGVTLTGSDQSILILWACQQNLPSLPCLHLNGIWVLLAEKVWSCGYNIGKVCHKAKPTK